jgi:hypothetical protein
VIVIESVGLLHARLKASLAGADGGLEFVSAQRLDQKCAGQIPANMIGSFSESLLKDLLVGDRQTCLGEFSNWNITDVYCWVLY